jgi:hypothetical protein
MKLKSLLSIAALCLLAQTGAQAVPLVYTGSVTVNGPLVTGSVGPFGWFDPFDSVTPPQPQNLAETTLQFWSFTGTAGKLVTITGRRLNNNLDPALALYRGTLTPGLDSSTTFIDPFGSWDGLTFIGGADDEIPTPGPFGDPRLVTFLPAFSGIYTIMIGGAASDCTAVPPPTFPDGCPQNGFPYSLQVQVPEPSTLPLILIAFAGVGWTLRRQGLA